MTKRKYFGKSAFSDLRRYITFFVLFYVLLSWFFHFYNHLFGIKKLTYIRPCQISVQTYANTEKKISGMVSMFL